MSHIDMLPFALLRQMKSSRPSPLKSAATIEEYWHPTGAPFGNAADELAKFVNVPLRWFFI